MILMIAIYLVFALLMLIPIFGVWHITSAASKSIRLLFFVLTATLLLTPSWGPATIAFIPMPFGLIFFITLFTWSWGGLLQLVDLAPIWHSLAFPITALIAYAVGRKII